MKPKLARKILSRLMWKIAEQKVSGVKRGFIKKAFHREIRTLRNDQTNAASQRVLQRLLFTLR